MVRVGRWGFFVLGCCGWGIGWDWGGVDARLAKWVAEGVGPVGGGGWVGLVYLRWVLLGMMAAWA